MEKIRKFVIQEHTKQNCVHWDLMLEAKGALHTYRFELPPDKLLGQRCIAVKIFDHSLKFLTYEGSVNNGKSSVQIADAGTYQLLNEDQGCFELQLDGRILKGNFTLTHTKDDQWEFALR